MHRALTIIITLSACFLFGTGCKSWDMPAHKDSVMLGSDGSSGRIAIVYHPGATGLTESMVTRLGEELVSRGYAVTLSTANPTLSLDQTSYKALVIGSPVYGAEVRPPIKDFISANAPLSVPVFAILTGGFGTGWYEEYDLPALINTLNQANVSLVACTKIASGMFEPEIKKRIAYLCNAIDDTLKNEPSR